MKTTRLFAAILLGLAFIGSTTASAQQLYWASSGKFGPFNIQILVPTYPEAKDIMVPVNMWVLDHPKGLVVYDTGNNVAISDGQCTSHWGEGFCGLLQPDQTRADVIDKVLERLGFSVADVDIVIHSHAHLDHIGNIEMFPDAIHVIQDKELYQAWWPESFQRGGAFVEADYDEARDFRYFKMDGDYDLFGDGSVEILSTPGHTIGHQSLKVTLPETGTVILTQDAIWFKENLQHAAGLKYSMLDYTDTVERLKMIRDVEGAPLWYGHSIAQYETMGEKWYK
jgi:glyoxylase-like metal-dependent hydrolase (beta-lactamase superfamily II)|tara:strand:- start:473 stop:1318 length:846 start_codon:yes stop_codon:yes gene_type:complete